jgi:HAMP domain-containing protein
MKLLKSSLFWQILIPILLVVLIPMGTLLAMGWFTIFQTENLIASGASTDAVVRGLEAMSRFNLLIALLTLIAILFVAFLITTRIINAVSALQSAIQSFEADSYQTKYLEETTRRKDEFGDLARHFERMTVKINDREERLRDEVTRLTIHIDTIQKHDAVDRIVSTDYFKAIEEKARLMRFRRSLSSDQPTKTKKTDQGKDQD